MATGTSSSKAILEKLGRDHLECGICHERYEQPKILDCQHSFCMKCLVQYHNTTCKQATDIPCPVCRRGTRLPEKGVQGLTTNLFVAGLVESFNLQERLLSSDKEGITCEICDEDNEVHDRCLDCRRNICSKCKKMHIKLTDLSGHTIKSLVEIREGKVRAQSTKLKHHPKCPNHEGEVTRFFCRTCKMLICRDCTVIDHSKHKYIDKHQAASTYKHSLTELFPKLEIIAREASKSRERVASMTSDLDTNADRTEEEVQSKADLITAEVTAQKARLIQDIKKLRKNRHQQLEAHEKTLSMFSERIKFSLATAKEVISGALDSDFLSLYPTISKDLTFLASQDAPRVGTGLEYVRFTVGQRVADINLGMLIEAKWELCLEFGKQQHEGLMNICTRNITYPFSYDVVVSDFYKGLSVFSMDGQIQTQILVERTRGVASMRNRLVAVSENVVKGFNNNDRLVLRFPTVPPSEVAVSDVGPWSVVIKEDETIIVGDIKRKALTEHGPDGSLTQVIPVDMKPIYMALHGNGRIVISGRSNSVHVTDSNGNTLTIIKPTIPGEGVVQCTGVHADNSGIYIAVRHNDNYTGHIHHYDAQGGFRECIAEGLYKPCGITFTADGKLLVADNKSLKMFVPPGVMK